MCVYEREEREERAFHIVLPPSSCSRGRDEERCEAYGKGAHTFAFASVCVC